MNKIIFLFFLLVVELNSCTNQVFEDNLETTDVEKTSNLKSAGDGKYDVLGYGWDITREMFEVGESNPVKYQPILNVQKFVSQNPGRFGSPSVSETDFKSYGGSNYLNYKKDVITKNKVNVGLWGILKENAEKSAFNLNRDKESTQIYSIKSTDGYSSVEAYKYLKRYFLDSNPTELSKFLSDIFVNDLNKLSANDIIKKYGTHVLIDFNTGGMVKSKFKCSFIEEYQETQKTKIAKYGLSINLKKFGINFSDESETTTKEYYTKKTNVWNFKIKIIGGAGNGLSYTIDSEGKQTTTVNLGSWSESINSSNAEVVYINWERTYPIYDFVSDPTKKAQIKQAYLNYINSKKVEMYEVRPLYRLYKPHNSFYTTYYDEALIYQARYGYKWDADYSPYVQGYVYAKKYNDEMVPLYRLYKKGNSFYTTSYTEALLHINSFGYKFDSDHSPYIQGYVFAKSKEGMVPLYRLYKGNSFYTTSYTEAQIYINNYGYRYDGDHAPYIQGYLIPNE